MTKTKLQIIEETAAAYANPDNRAFRGSKEQGNYKCFYLAPNGNNCAVGRCMIAGSRIESYVTSGSMADVSPGAGSIDNLEKILKPEYRGHNRRFWVALQRFHDYEEHFDLNKKEISAAGHDYLNNLRKKYE